MHCRSGHRFLHHSFHFLHFHLPHNLMHSAGHGSKKAGMHPLKEIPKGCLAVYVGQDEEQQRFIYANHPLFEKLLKEAEEEYGFEYEKGIITIPCDVADFEHVQKLIDKGFESTHSVGCFRINTRPSVSA